MWDQMLAMLFFSALVSLGKTPDHELLLCTQEYKIIPVWGRDGNCVWLANKVPN